MCSHQATDRHLALGLPRTDGKGELNGLDRAEPFSLHIYENEIPAFVGDHLEQLYGSIYCSLARIRLYESLEGISTFVATAGPDVRILILFRLSKDAVRVINQQVRLSEQDMSCFATAIFAAYPGVRRIEFYAMDTSIRSPAFGYPYQQIPQLEENVVVLPDSTDEYLRKLGKKTRTGILANTRKTIAAYPSYRFEVFRRDQITIDLVRAVVHMADMRMKFKHKDSYLRANEIETLARLAKTHGYISTITIDGRICAGNLCFNVGPRHFAQLLAHDPRYNRYALGHQINLQTILYGISQGAKEIWMMGGRSEEKSRFLTRQHFLNNIVIYRSRQAAIRSWPTFAWIEVRKTVFAVKINVQKKSLENNKAGRTVARLINLVRLARSVPGQAKRAVRTVLGRHCET